jgi:polyphosphate kinase 2 (PPK2 family)
MFETAELGRKLSKAEYKKLAPAVREDLLELQDRLLRSRAFKVILVFAGVDGGGKGETVSLLNEWLDPRWLKTRAYDVVTDYERQWPEFWRYWRDLPARGRIGMFLSAWYSPPILDHVYGASDEAAFSRQLDRIANFERTLAQDGALIIKFWMHLSREAQERRLQSLEGDPLTKARVTERDWEHWRMYDRFIATAEKAITRTNRGLAPWLLIEGADENYRGISVATQLRDMLRRQLQSWEAAQQQREPAAGAGIEAGHDSTSGKAPRKKGKESGARADEPAVSPSAITILSQLDMSQTLDKASYEDRLVRLQARLHRLHLIAKERRIPSVLVFEGPDAAGKGGAIRRINRALDARNYQVHGIAAPTDEEAAQHYMWRFWRRLAQAGRVCIFDRSWYGRVLVERVEGFASEAEWRRSYAEINDFEAQLIEHRTVLVKYWIHISRDEQLKRFEQREKIAYKQWKLTDEDWRNRDKWHRYEEAANDMVQFTSNAAAPWTLVEGNDKRFARVKVVETFCRRLAAALGEPLDEAEA